jgi:hypothetical protein
MGMDTCSIIMCMEIIILDKLITIVMEIKIKIIIIIKTVPLKNKKILMMILFIF